MLIRRDLPRLRNLGLLVAPAVVLPLLGLGAGALGPDSLGHTAVAEAAGLPASLAQPTPFKVKPFQVPLPIPPELAPVRSERGRRLLRGDHG
jgi:hypothetical protein